MWRTVNLNLKKKVVEKIQRNWENIKEKRKWNDNEIRKKEKQRRCWKMDWEIWTSEERKKER